MTIKAQTEEPVMVPGAIFEITVELARQAGAPAMRPEVDGTTKFVYAIGYLAGLAKSVGDGCEGGGST